MRRRLALLVVAATATLAHAGEHDATFAHFQSLAPDAVRDVHGFALPRGAGAYTHVLTGRYTSGKYVMTGVVLLACDARQCTGRRVGFGAADEIAVLGVVDLDGKPGPLPARVVRPAGRYRKLPGAGTATFPVLAVRTVERGEGTGTLKSGRRVSGTVTRTRLHLISLVAADRGSVVLHDTAHEQYPNGAGSRRSYRLERGRKAGTLELIATEQRMIPRDSRCLRPKPVEIRFRRSGHHFREAPGAFARGC